MEEIKQGLSTANQVGSKESRQSCYELTGDIGPERLTLGAEWLLSTKLVVRNPGRAVTKLTGDTGPEDLTLGAEWVEGGVKNSGTF